MTSAHVKLYTFDPLYGHSTFLAAYRWLSDEKTFAAYHRAKALFSTDFRSAHYAVNLYVGRGNLLDSFWLSTDLNELRKSCWAEAHLIHEAT